MTDERIGDRLWEALARLPAGAGVIFRHYSLNDADRLALGRKLAEHARDRELLLGVAGSRMLAEELGAALVHNPDRTGSLPASHAVHDEKQARFAAQGSSALAFIGPVFATRSHPNRSALGAERAWRLATLVRCPAIALGGMDEERFGEMESARPGAFHGFAGIDCWLND
jgi:thiamine-phosphate pyrophosphorylase